ncbi:MAG: 2-oxoacid:acceptor oxidoreductase subunit alpha [Thermodesulfobacteriota bacterium]|nr:2-oxoacid:acceptor oxidoreductase subunit alpha [Thermodesulfobacteriota bacterium]
MSIDITIRIGGEAGQGIQTAGHLLALVCQEAGLYILATNDFESRIRGGHSFFQIRISSKPLRAPHHKLHLLVALNQETYDLHQKDLNSGGLVVMDKKKGSADKKILTVPFGDLAKEAGGKIFLNTVAAGVCLALLGAPVEICQNVLAKQFREKGQDIVEKNYRAVELGYQGVKDIAFEWAFKWKPKTPKGAIIDGSKAIALGALAGDCRLAAFYPMSPATGIMAHLSSFSDKFPLVVEQAEDEIAAVNMIIGGAFAGARAMTATSGGGFCLMTEGLGLAGMTETPIVIVNAQRPGPATGLPTRTAQGDLHFVIRASQDEFPRFVFSPGTPYEAFEITSRAFHLSEKYQVPSIILIDQYLADSLFIMRNQLNAPANIERFIVKDEDIEDPRNYKRFMITPSGISPRALPCSGKALVVVSSDEHSEDGHMSEAIDDRTNMVEKRNAKVPRMIKEMNPPQKYHDEAEVLLVGWGSTKGAIREAVDLLRQEGKHVGCLNFRDLWPLPSDKVKAALHKVKRFLMVEQNSTAQFGQLIQEQTGLAHSGAILKYDGRPICPNDIVEDFKQFERK